MKLFKVLTFISIALPIFASVINFSVEPTRAFKDSYLYIKDRKTQWTIAGEYGWTLNEHFVFGPNIGFSWCLQKEKTTDYAPNTELVSSKERVIMLPISLFFIFDPIPQFMIHPIIHAQVGYNSVFISNVYYNSVGEDQDTVEKNRKTAQEWDGYYNGIISKFGLECMIDLGKSISIFAGPQWQISVVERRKKDSKPFERKFHGFGIRMGVSVLL